MAQYLLAVYYADLKPSAEEFQPWCVDVPALDAKMRTPVCSCSTAACSRRSQRPWCAILAGRHG